MPLDWHSGASHESGGVVFTNVTSLEYSRNPFRRINQMKSSYKLYQIVNCRKALLTRTVAIDTKIFEKGFMGKERS